MNQMTDSCVNSYDEWTPLKEVVVGVCEGYDAHDMDNSFVLFYFDNLFAALSSASDTIHSSIAERPRFVSISKKILDELSEDLEDFVKVLELAGVRVLRPAKLPVSRPENIRSLLWDAKPTPALNVRDNTIILGSNIVETAPHVRGRIFENDLLKPILHRYYSNGANWISMPRPALASGSIDDSYFRRRNLEIDTWLRSESQQEINGLGYEIVFDGAQCIRFGRDVVVNVSNQNHALGLEWMKRNFGSTFRFHRVEGMADNHIDSIVLPLRPGLLLLRSKEYRSLLPDRLRRWDIVVAPEPKTENLNNYVSETMFIASKYIDMNVLSIDESTVVVNSLNPELIKRLEEHRFTVIPSRNRHRRVFSGGFHCFTLDCVREGGLEDYL